MKTRCDLTTMVQRFTWQSAGLNQARFRAYSSLLLMKAGLQVGDRLEPEEDPDDQDTIDTHDDTDSISPQILTSFDESKLKAALQDRIAELISNVKGGQYVAATLLVERQDILTIIVARNEGLNQKDRKFLRNLERLLRDIAQGTSEYTHI
jgi:hypothetical protein